jgi:hypothetical protein
MSATKDFTRVVRSWIREEEHDSADHILQVVLSRLDSTPQRRSWWPAWRAYEMSNAMRIAVAAAAVVVVAIVGYQFLPRVGGGPGGVPSPTPLPTPTSELTARPAPSPTQLAFPPEGPLAIGTYSAIVEDIPLSFTVSSGGWRAGDGTWLFKGTIEQPDWAAVSFWPGSFTNIYADPCAHTPRSPVPGTTPAELAAVVATIPGADLVEGPTSITVGGRPAQYVVLTIPDDIPCEPHQFYLYYNENTGGPRGGYRYADNAGETLQVWIIDLGETLMWIDGQSADGIGPEGVADVSQIIDSIEFE